MNKLAVLRLDALGDTLLSTPALDAVKRQWPECQLVLFASRLGRPILEPFGEVEEIGPEVTSAQLGRLISKHQPEGVVVFTEKRRAIQAAHRSGVAVRAGFDPGMTQPLKSAYAKLALTHRLPFANDLQRPAEMHETERYQRLVELLGVEHQAPGRLRMPTEPAGEKWVKERFQVPPLAFQMTAKWTLDDWPADFLVTLIASLPEKPLLFTAPGEEDFCGPLLAQLDCKVARFTQLAEYAAALGACRALITVDTGAAHVAAAVGTPVVDVFRQAHHQHCVARWKPWGVASRNLLKGPFSDSEAQKLMTQVSQSLQELTG